MNTCLQILSVCGEIENDTRGIIKYVILLAGHEHHGKPGVNAMPEGSARAESRNLSRKARDG